MLTDLPLGMNSVRAVAAINLLLSEHKANKKSSESTAPERHLNLQSIQAAGRQAAIEDGVLGCSEGGHVSSQRGGKGCVADALSRGEARPATQGLRRGKWTAEEEEYSNRLIAEFKMGTLPLTDGTTLRTFLSKLLNCDPQIFRRNYFDGADQGQVDMRMEQTKRELAELERRFLEKVAESNMKMCTKYEDIADFGSAESSPSKTSGGMDSAGSTNATGGLLSAAVGSREWLAPWLKPPVTSDGSIEGGADALRNDGISDRGVRTAATINRAVSNGAMSSGGGVQPSGQACNGPTLGKRDMAPAVTMPFTLAQMHAAAEQNGIMEKSKKRVRQRRRSNSSVSASSDTSVGSRHGMTPGHMSGGVYSPRIHDSNGFQVPTHPMYSSFTGEWGDHLRGPSPMDAGRIGSSHKTPHHFDDSGGGGGSGMKRVSSLDLLCSSSMGHADMGEWSFGQGMQDWSNLSKGDTDRDHKKKTDPRGPSFGAADDVSDDGIRYVDDDGTRSVSSNIIHSDSTADLMALLGNVPGSRNSLGSRVNIHEDFGQDHSTPLTAAVFGGNRARTISGQSFEGSDFCISPRANPAEGTDPSRSKRQYDGLEVSGDTSSIDMPAPASEARSYTNGSAPGQQGNSFKPDGAGSDFMWSTDFTEEVPHSDAGGNNRKRTGSGDRVGKYRI